MVSSPQDWVCSFVEYRPRRAMVLIDASVAGLPLVGTVRSALADVGAHVTASVLSGPGDVDRAIACARTISGQDLMVALGGGSLIDQAKLAALVADEPETGPLLRGRGRCGLVVLPPGTHRSRPLVVVPTTVGTGAEVSRSACVLDAGRRRLVRGEALRPDLALLSTEAYTTLPGDLAVEGVLEALFRLTSSYAGTYVRPAAQDRESETVAARLVEVGDRIAGAHPPELGDLAEAAELSGLTHLDRLHVGTDPYAAKGWFLANEMSSVLGVRKMRAVAALLPPLWHAITDGNARLGSAERLQRLWSRMRVGASKDLPPEPSPGITALIDAWDIDRSLPATADQISAVARAAVRAWGAGLPMLGGLRRKEVHALISRSTSTQVSAPVAAGAESEKTE